MLAAQPLRELAASTGRRCPPPPPQPPPHTCTLTHAPPRPTLRQSVALNEAQATRKRGKMMLPAPQISDAELEQLARQGGEVGLDPEMAGECLYWGWGGLLWCCWSSWRGRAARWGWTQRWRVRQQQVVGGGVGE